ncbi:MAG: putative rane protein [Hyphomicrobiales bacterium]|nr:putative rane protein [Hyphomicrobiales bacterium]
MNQQIHLPPDLPAPHTPRHGGFGSGIRTWFLTGLIIAGPLTVTAWIVLWFINTVDSWIKPLVPVWMWPDGYLPVQVPGIGVVIAFLGLTLLGFLAANLAGRTLLKIGEMILDRMPVVRGIYKSVKQIFETVFSQSGTGFRRVGLVEFPTKGMWSIVFISSPPSPTMAAHLPGGAYISVFLPCTPNPTTGFYFYLPAEDVVEISLTPEEAAKLIMSAGLIQPETQQKLGALASQARGDAPTPVS